MKIPQCHSVSACLHAKHIYPCFSSIASYLLVNLANTHSHHHLDTSTPSYYFTVANSHIVTIIWSLAHFATLLFLWHLAPSTLSHSFSATGHHSLASSMHVHCLRITNTHYHHHLTCCHTQWLATHMVTVPWSPTHIATITWPLAHLGTTSWPPLTIT